MNATLANTLNLGHAGMTIRSVVSLALSVTVTLGLFWIVPYLIEVAESQLDHGETLGQLEFIRVPEPPKAPPRRKPPEPPRLPETPPEVPPLPRMSPGEVSATPVNIGDPEVDAAPRIGGSINLGVGEGDYLPIVKVAPIYPQRALSRGIEGYCVVQYTVTRNGTIRHPVVIEDQCTSSLFHKAALDAARKFKYKPRVIDGEAIEVPGVQNRFTFRISG